MAAAEEAWQKADIEYWAAAMAKGKATGSKGQGGKQKGKGKGLASYGERYNCGEWGHPARECPSPGKLHGGIPTAAAFKGCKGKGKFGKGKGKGGKGKGKQGFYATKRSLNYASENDYQAAWGSEDGGTELNPEAGDGGVYDYNGGHNYHYGFFDATNNSYSNNYGMLLMRTMKNPCKLSGSKYFTSQLLLHEDSDDDITGEPDEMKNGINSNINAQCTDSKQQFDSYQTKNKARGTQTKHKN